MGRTSRSPFCQTQDATSIPQFVRFQRNRRPSGYRYWPTLSVHGHSGHAQSGLLLEYGTILSRCDKVTDSISKVSKLMLHRSFGLKESVEYYASVVLRDPPRFRIENHRQLRVLSVRPGRRCCEGTPHHRQAVACYSGTECSYSVNRWPIG